MDEKTLTASLESPEVAKSILGDYCGALSLGVTLSPTKPDQPAIRVRIEGDASHIPPHITINGEQVEIVATGNFRAPLPYATASKLAL